MSKTIRFLSFWVLSIAAAGALFAAQSAQAANTVLYWDAEGTTTPATGGAGTWDITSSLWRLSSPVGALQAYPPTGATASANLSGTAGTITLGSGLTIEANNITFGTAGYTITGPADAKISFVGTTPTIDTGAGLTQTISAILDGSVALSKAGTGTLILSGVNKYSSTMTITAGGLNIQNAAALGTTAAGTTVNSGAALQLQGGITVGSEALFLNGTGISNDGALRNMSGANIWQGTVTLVSGPSGILRINSDAGSSLTFNTAANSITAANLSFYLGGFGNGTVGGTITIGAGQLIKDGSGVWTLSGANTFTGTTTINAGVLLLNNATALPGGIATTGGISALQFNGGIVGLGVGDFTRGLNNTASTVQFTNAGGWAAYGADRVVNLGGAAGLITWATATTGFNGKTLILGASSATHMVDFKNGLDLTTGGTSVGVVQVNDGAADVDGKLSGDITGIAGGILTKTGLGTLVLSGTNNYAGTTAINAGL